VEYDLALFDLVHFQKKEITETLKTMAKLKALFFHTFFFLSFIYLF
jgi:hypothetical protein